MRPIPLLVLICALAVIPLNTASAHGDLERSDPERGDHERKPPRTIALDFAEPPTADSNFEVTDGCRENVLAGVSGEGPNAVLQIDGGAPGRWKVEYRTVSSVDGHLVEGSFSFHVGNKTEPCEEPAPDPSATVDIGAPGPRLENEDGDGGLPLLPIGLAGVGIVAVALLIRRMGAS